MMVQFMAHGRLTKDPKENLRKVTVKGEDRYVCNFTIACDAETKDGETDFYDCVVWGRQAENLANYMSKGQLIYVSGRPHNRPYEKDGIKHRRTEYNIKYVEYLERGTGAPARVEDTEEIPF